MAEEKLYDAATSGVVETFQQVLQQHPHLLHVVSFPCLRNALHIAITKGHINIVEEVVKIKPELVREVDSKKSSSLHIAAAQGNVEIAKILLPEAPEMCWWLDDQGMNPIHIAAMKGHVHILEELLQQDLYPALERVHRGQTALHLCVKHRQLGTLKVLVEKIEDLACAKDDDGETLLHLAVRSGQVEMIRYLVGNNKIANQTQNSMGKSPLDIFRGNKGPGDRSVSLEIRGMLAGLSNVDIFPKLSEMTMVVVVLIATMAFQAAVSPPGGVWQDDTLTHEAGKAVMASTHPRLYRHFVRANNTAFISSLITIFLNTTPFPSKHDFFLVIASYAMWVSLASIGVSYGASLIMTNPMETHSIGHIVTIVVSMFIGIIVFIFVYFLARGLKSWWRKQGQLQDLTTAHPIYRTIHPINQWLDERHENLSVHSIPCIIISECLGSRHRQDSEPSVTCHHSPASMNP